MIISPNDPQIDETIANHFSSPNIYDQWYGTYGTEGGHADYFSEATMLINSNHTVLDIGCGTGLAGAVLKINGHTGTRIANDISLPMLEQMLLTWNSLVKELVAISVLGKELQLGVRPI